MSPHPKDRFEASAPHLRTLERPVFCGLQKHPRITYVDALILTQLLPDRNGDNFAEVVQALKQAGSEDPAADAYCIIGAYAAYSAAARDHRHPPYPQRADLIAADTEASSAHPSDLDTVISDTCDMRGALRQLATRFMASA